jgi:hypothetical protein
MYEQEKRNLLENFSDIVFDALCSVKGWIAGGAITSVFCNREISDYDLYFASPEDLFDFLLQLEGTAAQLVNKSDKAVTIMHDEKLYQAIYMHYYSSAKDIFNDYDFTVCMGAYNPRKEKFTLHPEFLHHNSLRILKFNDKTTFPLVSLLRVAKYKEKGYKISKLEMCKMLLAVNRVQLDSFESVAYHFGGMYGLRPAELFESVQDQPFSVDTALEALNNITGDLVDKADINFKDCTFKEFCLSLTGIKVKAFKTNLGYLGYYDMDTYEEDAVREIEVPKTFYKFVKKIGERYYSFADGSFEYVLGEEVVSKLNYYNTGLHFSFWHLLKHNCYISKEDSNKVLIECEFDPNEVSYVNRTEIRVNKTPKFIREVPLEEYKNVIQDS